MASVSVSVLREHRKELKCLVMMTTLVLLCFQRKREPSSYPPNTPYSAMQITINSFVVQLGISIINKAYSLDISEYLHTFSFILVERSRTFPTKNWRNRLFSLWTIYLHSTEQDSATYSSSLHFESSVESVFQIGKLRLSHLFLSSKYFSCH